MGLDFSLCYGAQFSAAIRLKFNGIAPPDPLVKLDGKCSTNKQVLTLDYLIDEYVHLSFNCPLLDPVRLYIFEKIANYALLNPLLTYFFWEKN